MKYLEILIWGCKHGLFLFAPKNSVRKLWSSFSGHLSHSFNLVFISVSLTPPPPPQHITMKFQGLYSPALALQSITRFLSLFLSLPLSFWLCLVAILAIMLLVNLLNFCRVHVSLQMLLHCFYTSHMDARVSSNYIIFSYITENVPRQYTTENLALPILLSFLISHSLCNSQSFLHCFSCFLSSGVYCKCLCVDVHHTHIVK